MKWFRKISVLFRKTRVEAEMADEIRNHLELLAEQNLSAGMTPAEARQAAHRSFGGVDQIKEASREQRGIVWLEQLFRDFRIGCRVLVREKSFFFISVAVLALGICGVTTQFSVINSALLRGLPFAEPDRLVRVGMRDPTWVPERSRNLWVSDMLEWSRDQKSFEGLAAYYIAGSFIVTSGDLPQRFPGSHVTDGFFALLGVKPALGRTFTPNDNRPEADRVTVISDSLWNSNFSRDPNILGRTIRLNGRMATIVGVMPPHFNFPRDQLWLPMFNEYPIRRRAGSSAPVLARLKPGVSIEQATAELSGFARQAAQLYPETNRAFTEVVVEPLLNVFVPRDARQLLYVMFTAVAAVLLIACLNVMNMQFTRAVLRTRELAVRGALGASRGRLVAQMLVESLIVAVAGGAVGSLAAYGAVDIYSDVMGRLPGGVALPAWLRFEIDGAALGFTVAVTGAAVIVSGLLPALVASRTNTLDVLKEGSRGHTSGLVARLTGVLVVGQIGLTGALLVASLLLIKSVNIRYALNFGYDLEAVLAGRMNFEGDYRNEDALLAVQARLLEHLRSSPQFTHAAFTTRRNMMTSDRVELVIEGRGDERAGAWSETVSEGYFATLGLQPLQGREFDSGDTRDKPVPILVNASFARKYFAGEPPIGRRLKGGLGGGWYTIVGVVPDTLMQGPLDARSDEAGVFYPSSVYPQSYATLVVRSRGSPASQFESVRREVARIDPHLAIYVMDTPRGFLRSALAQTRTVTTLFSLFGIVAVVLSIVGLYGVAAFSVSQRTQELGIRIALGAPPGEIVRLVLKQGGVRFAFGAALGLGLGFVVTRMGAAVLNNFLYKTSPHDPATYCLVALLLAAATLLACLIPARRATKVDPIAALRCD